MFCEFFEFVQSLNMFDIERLAPICHSPVGKLPNGLIHVCCLTLARIRCFTTFGRTGGGLVRPPPLGVSKRSVVELSGKDQQIALAEYSRLVVLFLVLGQYLTQLLQVKGQIFGNSMIFQLYESISAKLSIVAAWDLHQRVPRSILHRMRCFGASRLNI